MMKSSIHRIAMLTALVAGLLLLSACKTKTIEYPSDTREVLGTKVTITLYAEGQLVDNVQRVFDQSFATMAHWEQMTLSKGDQNQIKKVSEGAGTQSMTIDPEVFELIMASTRLHDASGKLFDIRTGPLYDAWGFDSTPAVPDSAALATALDLVQNGGMFVAGKSILLAKEGMSFDVRFIVEGYVFDLVGKQLKELGFVNFTIASPTVFLAVGQSPYEKGFEMPLHHPLYADSVWADLYVSSGGYAYLSPVLSDFEQDGKTYHALLQPMTGMPADKLTGSIVHAADAATAEAMAFAEFVEDEDNRIPDEGKNMIKGSIKITNVAGELKREAAGTLAEGFELAH